MGCSILCQHVMLETGLYLLFCKCSLYSFHRDNCSNVTESSAAALQEPHYPKRAFMRGCLVLCHLAALSLTWTS